MISAQNIDFKSTYKPTNAKKWRRKKSLIEWEDKGKETPNDIDTSLHFFLSFLYK